MNAGSQSETMKESIACKLKDWSMRTWPIDDGVKGCDKEQKSAHLEK